MLNLLFTGPKSTLELRRLLKQRKIKISASALSRLMTRLQWRHHIDRQYKIRTVGGRKIRQCTFAVTEYGVSIWTQTRQFYFDLSPPAADFIPASTPGSKLAHLSPRAKNKKMMRELVNEFPSLFQR
jgi:hypothetical protein